MDIIEPIQPISPIGTQEKKSITKMDNDFIKFTKKHINEPIVKGVGSDAEIVKNDKGGLQSKAIGAFYLIDADFITNSFVHKGAQKVATLIALFMKEAIEPDKLVKTLRVMYPDMLERIAKVMEYGATKANGGKGYPTNNWRLIPQEQHINHALIHLYALDRGDVQDNHLDHALTRIMMALATEPSEGFKGYYKT